MTRSHLCKKCDTTYFGSQQDDDFCRLDKTQSLAVDRRLLQQPSQCLPEAITGVSFFLVAVHGAYSSMEREALTLRQLFVTASTDSLLVYVK